MFWRAHIASNGVARSRGYRTGSETTLPNFRRCGWRVSNDIHETLTASEGRFTAYKDGRVRVQFTDRTLLKLDATGQLCDVVLPSGEQHVVSWHHPANLKPYIDAAAFFQYWTFLTAEQRQQLAQTEAAIEQTALQCRIQAALLLKTADADDI